MSVILCAEPDTNDLRAMKLDSTTIVLLCYSRLMLRYLSMVNPWSLPTLE